MVAWPLQNSACADQAAIAAEAFALQRRLSAEFDRAAHNDFQSLEHARALMETLKREGRWMSPPAR